MRYAKRFPLCNAVCVHHGLAVIFFILQLKSSKLFSFCCQLQQLNWMYVLSCIDHDAADDAHAGLRVRELRLQLPGTRHLLLPTQSRNISHRYLVNFSRLFQTFKCRSWFFCYFDQKCYLKNWKGIYDIRIINY